MHNGVVVVLPVLLGGVHVHLGAGIREIYVLHFVFRSVFALVHHRRLLPVPHNLLAVGAEWIDHPVVVDTDETRVALAHCLG